MSATRSRRLRALAFAIAGSGSIVANNAFADPPLTLEDAIEFALAHHPSLQTAIANEHVAGARTEVARAEELPQGGISAQLMRGTGNVVPGALFAMPGIPAVAGPPRGRAFDAGAWGSAAGTWVDWQVTDLARRMMLVDAAIAEERQAQARMAARRLQVAYEAADAFVTVLDAHEAVRAMQSNAERARVFATTVHVLVSQQLRPGADAARADADVALAMTLISRAQQAEDVQRARLSEALGAAGQTMRIVDALPPEPRPAAAGRAVRHPLLVEADAALCASQLREHAAGLEYLPRVDLVASLWFRGSGYFEGGANLGAGQGILPDTPNWAAGVVLSWPLMEIFATHARTRVAAAQVAVQSARRREIEQTILGQIDAARAMLVGARRVAENTAPAVEAARAAETQARARYQAGLATAVEVADAQRLLAQAELDDVSARIGVRRAMLLLARATGDLSPFLIEGARAAAGGH